MCLQNVRSLAAFVILLAEPSERNQTAGREGGERGGGGGEREREI